MHLLHCIRNGNNPHPPLGPVPTDTFSPNGLLPRGPPTGGSSATPQTFRVTPACGPDRPCRPRNSRRLGPAGTGAGGQRRRRRHPRPRETGNRGPQNSRRHTAGPTGRVGRAPPRSATVSGRAGDPGPARVGHPIPKPGGRAAASRPIVAGRPGEAGPLGRPGKPASKRLLSDGRID